MRAAWHTKSAPGVSKRASTTRDLAQRSFCAKHCIQWTPINLNDGFGGGHRSSGNLIFNMVRETCDHGCINSWDRLPLLSDVGIDGETASYFPKENAIWANFLINNYQSVWPLE